MQNAAPPTDFLFLADTTTAARAPFCGAPSPHGDFLAAATALPGLLLPDIRARRDRVGGLRVSHESAFDYNIAMWDIEYAASAFPLRRPALGPGNMNLAAAVEEIGEILEGSGEVLPGPRRVCVVVCAASGFSEAEQLAAAVAMQEAWSAFPQAAFSLYRPAFAPPLFPWFSALFDFAEVSGMDDLTTCARSGLFPPFVPVPDLYALPIASGGAGVVMLTANPEPDEPGQERR